MEEIKNKIIEQEIITRKEGKEYEVVYDKTLLCPGKVDSVTFNLIDAGKHLTFYFIFSNDGEPYSTNYIEDQPKENTLIYILNRWDADNTYVEISKPIYYKDYIVMFRNQSAENLNHRLFYFTLLKEKNGR